MPTVLKTDGFRFFFFSNEGSEPPHIHVEHGDGYAKFWLRPRVELAWSERMKAQELSKARRLVLRHIDDFMERWHATQDR